MTLIVRTNDKQPSVLKTQFGKVFCSCYLTTRLSITAGYRKCLGPELPRILGWCLEREVIYQDKGLSLPEERLLAYAVSAEQDTLPCFEDCACDEMIAPEAVAGFEIAQTVCWFQARCDLSLCLHPFWAGEDAPGPGLPETGLLCTGESFP